MPLPPLVDPGPALSDAERERTARHAVLPGIGEIGQRRLGAAHVAIVGAGGLGSPAVLALAAAGVGRLTVIDDDAVELSNLQRQVIHRRADIGAPKVASAVRVAADLSPTTRVTAVDERVDATNADRLLAGADLVIDGTDTFPVREIVAAATERAGIPLVWGTLQGTYAQVTVFWSAPPAPASPVVLADLYPPGSVGEVPSCADTGVLGALCLQVGGVLAIEAMKLIVGLGESLLGRVLAIDALAATQREVPLGPAQTRMPPQAPPAPAQLSVAETLAAQTAGATILDVREPHETATGVIPGARTIPLQQLLADPAAAGPGPVVTVCLAGGRARTAAEALRAAGVEASVLAGGMQAWHAGVPA